MIFLQLGLGHSSNLNTPTALQHSALSGGVTIIVAGYVSVQNVSRVTLLLHVNMPNSWRQTLMICTLCTSSCNIALNCGVPSDDTCSIIPALLSLFVGLHAGATMAMVRCANSQQCSEFCRVAHARACRSWAWATQPAAPLQQELVRWSTAPLWSLPLEL